jgi:hypothetical protein
MQYPELQTQDSRLFLFSKLILKIAGGIRNVHYRETLLRRKKKRSLYFAVIKILFLPSLICR